MIIFETVLNHKYLTTANNIIFLKLISICVLVIHMVVVMHFV